MLLRSDLKPLPGKSRGNIEAECAAVMRSRFDSEAVYFWRNEYRRCGGEKSVQGKCFGAAKPEIHLRPASMLAIHRHTTHLCDTGLLMGSR